MVQTVRRFFLTLLLVALFTPNLLASESDSEHESESPIDIMGVVQDHNHFQVPEYINGGEIPLPRIFYWETSDHEKKFSFFLTSHAAVESGLFSEHDHVLEPVDHGHILIDFSITSHLVYFWFGMGIAILLTLSMANRYKKGVGSKVEPKGALQNVFEIFFVFVRDEIARANIDRSKSDRYVPYLFTVFMGIAFMNLFGLFPWAATATADITVTAILAIFTFFIVQFSGTKDYWAHIFWFPGVPLPVKILMIPVELMGMFTKPFALSIRLFANMMSGKIMIIAIIGLVFIFNSMYGVGAAYGVSVFSVVMTSILYILKAFVALLQAYIFTLLSSVFIGMAAEEHHHDEAHHAEHA